MRVFVTGASGWIGSAVVLELIEAGHSVLGLARSDHSADSVAALGADVHRGSLDDIGSLRAGAEQAEGIVHLAYHHDFSQMAEAAQLDRAAVGAFGDVLAGSDAPLIVAAGVLGIGGDEPATELDQPDPAVHPRVATGAITLDLAERGVRSVVMRFAPTVHGPGDHGFVATLTDLARRTGVSAYVGDGSNHWSAVHRRDAAKLVRLAVESAPAGSVLHAVDEGGVRTRDIAEAIGRSLGVPVESVPAERATAHFGWIGNFFAMNALVSNTVTRELLGWTPTHPGLLEDIEAGAYADATPHATAGRPA